MILADGRRGCLWSFVDGWNAKTGRISHRDTEDTEVDSDRRPPPARPERVRKKLVRSFNLIRPFARRRGSSGTPLCLCVSVAKSLLFFPTLSLCVFAFTSPPPR